MNDVWNILKDYVYEINLDIFCVLSDFSLHDEWDWFL